LGALSRDKRRHPAERKAGAVTLVGKCTNHHNPTRCADGRSNFRLLVTQTYSSTLPKPPPSWRDDVALSYLGHRRARRRAAGVNVSAA
jgi:hypothetical protein